MQYTVKGRLVLALVGLSGLPRKAMSTKPFLSLSGEEELDKSFVPDRMVSAGVVVGYQGKEKLLHFLRSDLELRSRYHLLLHQGGHIQVHLQPSLSSHLEDITAEQDVFGMGWKRFCILLRPD